MTIPELIASIAKGTQDSKLDAYRLLLIQHSEDADALAAMNKKLIKEPNASLFKNVMELDQSIGPRLHWPTILDKRLQQCKSKDARYDALKENYDYGENETEILSRVALEDEEEDHRAWALTILLRKNEGSTSPELFELIMNCIERDPLTARTRSNSVDGPLWYLGFTQALYDFVANELEQAISPKWAKGLGSILSKHPEEFLPLIKRIQQICEGRFGCAPNWNDIQAASQDQNHGLCQLLATLFDHGIWHDEFVQYASSLAEGPILNITEQLSNNTNGPGWTFYRNFSDYLAYKHKNKELAAQLLLKLLEEKNIAPTERWFMTPHYVNLQSARGLTREETKQTLSHLLNEKNEIYYEKAQAYFDQDDNARKAALEANEKARLERVKNKIINDTALTFVNYISAAATNKERQIYTKPLSRMISADKSIYNSDTVNGEALFSILCSLQNKHDDNLYIIHQDAREREVVVEMIDRSRETLRLSIEDDVYTSDEQYSADVIEQYQLYDRYLNSKGFKLVHIYPGWDDFSAVIIALSQKDNFIDFMERCLPNLDYGF